MVINFFNDLIIFREKLFVVLEDTAQIIRNILFALIANKLAVLFSWARREKKAFSSLYVAKLIKGLF